MSTITRRDALTVMAGGLATVAVRPTTTTATLAAPLGGFLVVIRPDGSGPSGEVQVTEKPDGSYLVRPVRSDPEAWKDR